MVLLKVELKAELENLTDFQPTEGPEAFSPFFKVKCGSCREVHENWITVNPEEEIDMPGSRGTAHFVWSCPFCKRQSSASMDTAFKPEPYTAEDSESHKWKALCKVECRGCEMVEFDPHRNTWKAAGRESGTKFDDIELEDWTDYDEKAGEPVGITEVETRISRA